MRRQEMKWYAQQFNHLSSPLHIYLSAISLCPQTNFYLRLGVLASVPILVKIDTEMRP